MSNPFPLLSLAAKNNQCHHHSQRNTCFHDLFSILKSGCRMFHFYSLTQRNGSLSEENQSLDEGIEKLDEVLL
jgi:hypothetical protein